MTGNKLKPNMDKPEFLLTGSHYNLTVQPSLTLTVGNTSIHSVSSVRNIGVMFDSCFTMSSQVWALCHTLNHQLRNIAHIRKYLDEDACKHIIRALITSHLDYGNSLLLGITKA